MTFRKIESSISPHSFSLHTCIYGEGPTVYQYHLPLSQGCSPCGPEHQIDQSVHLDHLAIVSCKSTDQIQIF